MRTLLVAVVFLAGCFPESARAELPEWTPAAKPPTFAFRVVFGLNAAQAADYSGTVAVRPGDVVKVEGWHFNAKDRITGTAAWRCHSIRSRPRRLRPDQIRRGMKPRQPKPQPIGVLVYVEAPLTAEATLTLPKTTYRVKLADLKYGRRVNLGDGKARAERIPLSDRLTHGPVMNDFPSVTRDPAGIEYLVYLGWKPDADEPLARCAVNGAWGPVLKLAPTPGDNFETQVAAAGDGSVWAIWSSREGHNWDLWGRRLDGGKPGKLERLTTDPGAEFYHGLTADARGRLWLVWQSARNGQYDIYLKSYADGAWGPERRITSNPANDWEPAVAVGRSGTVYIAWDSYRNGNYDLFLRTLAEGKLSPVKQLTAGPRYEAHVSLAVDPRDRLWLAWEEGGVLWGKDQGFLIPERGFSRLHSNRTPRLACLDDGTLKEPRESLVRSLPRGMRRMNELPRVFFDGQGRLWVLYRRSERKLGGGNPKTIWHDYAAFWDGAGWRCDIWIPYTAGREDVRIRGVPLPHGGLLLTWASDERPWRNPIPGNYTNPGSNNVYTTILTADRGVPDLPPLKPFQPTKVHSLAPNLHPHEAADVARRRAVRWTVGGREYRLLTGETHRHTDVSFDGGGDSTMYDMMRYEIDAVQQEFIAAWDHDNGGGQDYSWWRSQKLADLFYLEDTFEPLYGYERSNGYPNGHRNVVFAHRGVRCLARDLIRNPKAKARRKFVLSSQDTKKLYAYLKANDGLCFSHTSATDMGTDWRDNDPEVEPDVEIYQGCRTSYEYAGAPRAATADKVSLQNGGYRPAGFVWNALAKGYRLGFQAASDHGSTHISYAGVWATGFSRQAIFDAFKARHCFGATDNLVVMFGTGTRMMGDEFTAKTPPLMRVKVLGTAPVTLIEVIKDNAIVYAYHPADPGPTAEFTWRDGKPTRRTSYYYVRVQQADGQLAWASPLWITYR